MKRVYTAALLALLLTGCGPQAPLELAVRKIPVNILLGAEVVINTITHTTPVAPPPTPVVAVAPTPTPSAAAPSPTPTIPVPSPIPCPTLGPFDFPAEAAPPDLVGQVKPGNYPFRNNGVWQPDTSAKTVYKFPPDATHIISTPNQTGLVGAYTYDLKEGYSGLDGKGSTVTSFLVQPTNPTSGGTGAIVPAAAGIYITKIASFDQDGHATGTFMPNPPINYLELPLSFGLTWDTAGSDGGTTLSLHMAIDDSAGSKHGKRVVNACGTPLDSWEVHAMGNYVSSTEKLAVDWVYDVATQLGGMTVQSTYRANGTTAPLGPTVLSVNTTTISRVTPE